MACWTILATALLLAHGFLAAGQGDEFFLSGFFETAIEFTQTSSVAVKRIALNATAVLGEWVASADAKFTASQFDVLSFYAAGPLGNIRLNSSLLFDPSALSFSSWQAAAAFDLLDVAVSDTLYLGASPAASYSLLTLSGAVGGISLQTKVKLGICPLSFWEAGLCAEGTWPACDVRLKGCLELTDLGFRALTLSVAGVALFSDLLGVDAFLDLSIAFTLDEKTFSPSLRFQPDWPFCVDVKVLGEFTPSGAPVGIGGLSIHGFVGECALENGITFAFAESLHPDKNSSITGKAAYWESLRVAGPLPWCCEEEGTFEVTAYFGGSPPPSGALFGVGLFAAGFDLQILDGFRIALAAEYPTNGSPWSVLATFRVFW